MTDTSTRTRAVALGVALGAALAALGACTQGGRDDYVRDGDTGAAAPATVPTLDHPQAPDSTAGVSARTGKRGVAGDTSGSKGASTGATNPTAAAAGKNP